MPGDGYTLEEIRQMAADIGLRQLTEEHLAQLQRAANAARARRGSLKLDTLVPADEPAHVFRLEAR